MVGGQRVELFLNPEWARYFDSLNTQVVVTSSPRWASPAHRAPPERPGWA
jgi:hypothetical protein